MRVYVEIPFQVGDYRTELFEDALATATAQGAVIGETIGGEIDRIGSNAGSFIGGAIGFFDSLFGKKQRVREIMREILFTFMAQATTQVGRLGGGKVVLLSGEYQRVDIIRVIDQAGQSVVSALEPGSDPHTDISRAFSTYQLHDTRKSGFSTLMAFDEAGRVINTTDPANGVQQKSNFGILATIAGLAVAFGK